MRCLGKSSFRKKYISDPDTGRMTKPNSHMKIIAFRNLVPRNLVDSGSIEV